MKAWIVQKYEQPLKLTDLPDPSVGDHDVLVDIHATAVNLLDAKVKNGEIQADPVHPRDRREAVVPRPHLSNTVPPVNGRRWNVSPQVREQERQEDRRVPDTYIAS
jgi:hypothetical protein